MKSKLSWFSFVPCTLAATALMVLHTLGIFREGNLLPFVSSFILLGMFVINIIFAAVDKKTSPAYLLSRNIPLAVLSMFTAAFVSSSSALVTIINLSEGKFSALTFAVTLFGLICAICFVFIAVAHLQGRNFLPRMGVMFLSMPIWGGLSLISLFLDNRYISSNDVDPLKMFTFCFITLYVLKLAMVITTVNGKNPVKAMFLYGMPLAGFGITYGVTGILSIAVNGLDYSENVIAWFSLSLGLYALLFNVELTRLARTTEEQILVYDLDDFDENLRIYGAAEDTTVVAPDTQTGDYDYDYTSAVEESESYVTSPDDAYTSDYDYDYGYGDRDEEAELVVAPDVETEDDAIYVERDIVEDFEGGVFEANAEARSGEAELTPEQQARIDAMIDDINSTNN